MPLEKKMGYLYRFDTAEFKYSNEIAPSPTGAFKLKKHVFSKLRIT